MMTVMMLDSRVTLVTLETTMAVVEHLRMRIGIIAVRPMHPDVEEVHFTVLRPVGMKIMIITGVAPVMILVDHGGHHVRTTLGVTGIDGMDQATAEVMTATGVVVTAPAIGDVDMMNRLEKLTKGDHTESVRAGGVTNQVALLATGDRIPLVQAQTLSRITHQIHRHIGDVIVGTEAVVHSYPSSNITQVTLTGRLTSSSSNEWLRGMDGLSVRWLNALWIVWMVKPSAS